MKSILPIIFIIFPSLAQEDANICSLGNPAIVMSREIPGAPGYFFRAFPDEYQVSYANDSGNQILNLETGKMTNIPGTYDPVPTWNNWTMTTPVPGRSGHVLHFYDMEKLKKDGTNTGPIFVDDQLNGTYQSIGTLNEIPEKGEYQYRVITDFNGGSYQDYELKKNLFKNIKVKTKHSSPKKVCNDLNLNLPMLSKDGKMVAGVDKNQNPYTTKLYKILEDGHCEAFVDFGFVSGKVDFNFQGDKVVFHKSLAAQESFVYFETPPTRDTKNIFVLNLKTNNISQITHNYSGNSYYPVFNRKGEVVYVQQQIGDDDTTRYSFQVADPDKTPDQLIDKHLKDLEQCNENTNTPAPSILSLGALWIDICGKTLKNIEKKQAMQLGLTITPEQCNMMVDRYLDKIRDPVFIKTTIIDSNMEEAEFISKNISKDSYLSICNSLSSGGKIFKSDEGRSSISDPKTLVQVKCLLCHDKNEFKNAGFEKIKERIESNDESFRMPRGSSLTETEKKDILGWLREHVTP